MLQRVTGDAFTFIYYIESYMLLRMSLKAGAANFARCSMANPEQYQWSRRSTHCENFAHTCAIEFWAEVPETQHLLP